jgi:hypothetical protein
MIDPSEPDEERVASRGQLLPEEQAAGSDDPQAQAEAILADSDARVADPEGTKRDSTQTPGD